MLLILNLPANRHMGKASKDPISTLFPLILLICLIGVYSVQGSLVDMVLMILFGIIGYLMKKFKYEIAPVVLALILGKIMEPSLNRSLIMSSGSITIFFTRPISRVLMMAVAVILIFPLF